MTHDLTDDEIALCEDRDDARRDYLAERKAARQHRCADGMCGALDCPRCHPASAHEEE